MSLRVQLSLVFSAIIAFILITVAVSVYVLTERSLTTALVERSTVTLNDLMRTNIGLRDTVRQLPSDTYYQIVLVNPLEQTRPDATPLSGPLNYTGNSDLIEQLDVTDREKLLREGELTTRIGSGEDVVAVHARIGAIQFPLEQAPTPAVFAIGISGALMQETLTQLRFDLTFIVLLAFLGVAITVWLVSSFVLRPLRRVATAASKITSSALSERVPSVSNYIEIRNLTSSLNAMLGRLEESFDTQRRFTADASHELRTPVTSIAGHANYLLRRTELTDSQRESLSMIGAEADRMTKLVNDLLELARADAGFTMTLEPLNFVEVVTSVAADLEHLAAAQQAKITVVAPHPLAEVVGDSARLHQVVSNLVSNALNAGAKQVTLTLLTTKDGVELEVLDDGRGIPEEALPHLFSRFFRIDGARSSGTGSGLGLAIVQWIVQQHRGSVTVESKVGEGSVFRITLPTPKRTLFD